MGVRQGVLEIRDFSSNPGTSWVVTVPNGHTIASITAVGVGLSISGQLRARPSISGTPTSAAARAFVGDTTTSQVVSVATIGLALSGAGTAGLYGTMQMYNLNTLAPVTCFMEHFSTSYGHWSGIYKTVTSFSEIIINANGGGTLNAGTIYVQFYKRSNEVISQDFSVSPVVNWDITNLKRKSSSAIVLSSYDLVLSATKFIQTRVSTDGVTFDAGGSDYRRGRVKDVEDTADLATLAYLSPSSGGTDQGLCALITGAPVKCRTLFHSTDIRVMSSGANITMSNREQRQTEKAIRILVGDGTTSFDGGTGYAVKYSL